MTSSSTSGQIRKTARHSAVYAIGTLISRLTALVMLPIYTRYLTPEDYGVIELLTMAIELTGILMGFRITQAMFRYYIMSDSEVERRQVVSTVLLTVMAASGFGTLVLYQGGNLFSEVIFGTTQYAEEFKLFSFTLVTNAISACGLGFLRARQKPRFYLIVSIVTLALQVTLNLIFVVYMNLHVTGVVYSALVSGIIMSVFFMAYILSRVGINYSKTIFVKLVNFVAPLILASVGAFIVAYADKYFIRVFGVLAEVGIYSLAVRVTSVMLTAFESFNMSWSADRYEIVKRDDARLIYGQVFKLLNLFIIIAGSGLAIFAGDFFFIMTDPSFYSASSFVPFLVLCYLLKIYSMFCNFGIMLGEQTRYMAESAWLKAVVAILGYVSLIPAMGIYGAVFSLLISNFVEFFWVNRKSIKLYDMKLPWADVAGMIALASVLSFASMFFPIGDWLYFFMRVSIFIVLCFSLFMLPIWSVEEKAMLRGLLFKLPGKGLSH